MKLITALLPLAALTSAFVLPDEEMTSQMVLESQKEPQTFLDRIQGGIDNVWSEVEDSFKDAVALGENALDAAINSNINTFECHHSMTKFDTQGWLDSAIPTVEDVEIDWTDDHGDHKPPHHPPKRPHRGHPPHKRKHHNKTVYELINESKYTTKLAKLINEYPDLVEALNGTAANYTVFAPTDAAFAKIPDHHKKPSKELIKKVLAYHVSADYYPAGRVLVSHTIPTILGEDAIGGEAQRLRVGFGIPKGLNINFYSKVIAVNIFGTNGVIHGIDSILLPPPPATTILSLLPGEFSTLLLGLEKTGLFEALKVAPHAGGTFFAPSNFAFKKLGPKINAFLFSRYGEKYLKALLKYHVVANQTLYSDAFYKSTDVESEKGIPKGHFHVDLPTLLGDKSLSIDVARFGGFIKIKINGFSSVAVQDGIAKDGVIHVVSNILIPPKTPGGKTEEVEEEMDLEEFKERLETFYKEL